MAYKSDLENLSDAGVGAVLAEPKFETLETPREDDSVVLINKNMTALDLDAFADGERRKQGKFITGDVADFAQFVKDESQPEHTRIFLNEDEMRATAYLNYGQEGYAMGKLDYQAKLQAEKTPVFAKLTELHNTPISQRNFVDILTDYAPVFKAYNVGGDEIDMGKAINELRKVTISDTKTHDNNVQNFSESRSHFENIEAKTSEKNSPVKFVVHDACYQNLKPVDVTLRLSITADSDGKPRFKLIIAGHDLLLKERADAFAELVRKSLDNNFAVLKGEFELPKNKGIFNN